LTIDRLDELTINLIN